MTTPAASVTTRFASSCASVAESTSAGIYTAATIADGNRSCGYCSSCGSCVSCGSCGS